MAITVFYGGKISSFLIISNEGNWLFLCKTTIPLWALLCIEVLLNML